MTASAAGRSSQFVRQELSTKRQIYPKSGNTTHRSIAIGSAAPNKSNVQRGPERSALLFVVKLAVAGVGERSKDGAGASIDRLTNVHGEGENKDETEEIDTKQRMQ